MDEQLMERFKLIEKICRDTDDILWNALRRSQNGLSFDDNNGKIIYPEYRNGNLRVSEQEARFAFVEALLSRDLLYAVEVPTRNTYTFEGETPLSAQTDLVVYESPSKPLCNIEFKAKGISLRARNITRIQKDFLKLFLEPYDGLWFHLIEAVDNSTVKNLFSVMVKAIESINQKYYDLKPCNIAIHIHVLKQGFSLHKNLHFSNNLDNIQKELDIELEVTKKELTKRTNNNGWNLYLWNK